MELSREYVLEELAVFALQSRTLPAVEVYPGTSLQSVTYMKGRILPEVLSPLSTRYVARIDFEQRRAAEAVQTAALPATVAKRIASSVAKGIRSNDTCDSQLGTGLMSFGFRSFLRRGFFVGDCAGSSVA